MWTSTVPPVILIVILSLFFIRCGPGLLHASFLISWSADGSRAAIAPWPFENSKDTDSGLWILDTARHGMKKIVGFEKGRFCLHPQWSPYADELVFALIEMEGNEPKRVGDRIPFSVWIVDKRGEGLRKIAESSCNQDAFLTPHLVTWGGCPGTILYPEDRNGKIGAVRLDLTSMEKSQFLPSPATTYLIRFSPDRDKVAALLYRGESKTADLYLGDIPLGIWWKLDTLPCAAEAFEFPDPTIYWSNDGSRFAVPSLRQRSGSHDIHLYDSQSRLGVRIEADIPETGLFWNADGSGLVYSVAPGAGSNNPPGLYRADIRSGRIHPLLLLEDYHVLSWNRADDRIYLIHESEEGHSSMSPALSSCSPSGSGARWLVAPPLDGDWGWHASPQGDKLMFITVKGEVRLLHLDTEALSPALKLQ
jgi:Tol biopolymer transport system component